MATTVGQHSVAAFTSPINGTTPIDANTVRSNDNTVRLAYVDHDADTGIHVQSSNLASRPIAGTAGRKWITEESGVYTLWFDDGVNWHPVSSEAVALTVLCTTALNRGDVVKIVGWNNGQDLPEVAKVASSSDIAFAVMTQNATINTMGYAINTGTLQDIDTAAFAVGNILYPNTTGGFTTTKPTSGVYQPVAFVLRSNASNGVVYVEFSAPRIVEASTNTASTVVLRDGSGNFSAGAITASSLAGTLTTAAQPNITSVGTLSTLTVSGAITASGGTANSVAYLNASKVLSTSANLTYDGTTLAIYNGTADNQRLNISTSGTNVVLNATRTSGTVPQMLFQIDATERMRLDATGNLLVGTTSVFNGASNRGNISLNGATDSIFNFGTGGTNSAYLWSTATYLDINVGSSRYMSFSTAATERMRLDASGNLGLGVTPSAWGVFKAFQFGTVGSMSSGSGITTLGHNLYFDGTNFRYLTATNASFHEQTAGQHKWYTAPSGTAGNAITFTQAMTLDASGRLLVGATSGAEQVSVVSSDIYQLSIKNASASSLVAFGCDSTNNLRINVNGAERARIDASGNLGIGVTPSAWSSITALQVGTTGSMSSVSGITNVGHNLYFDGTNFRYLTATNASLHQQASGQHRWFTAASGTAGNTISFTQAMTLDASGNLGVGTTSPTLYTGFTTLDIDNPTNGGLLNIKKGGTTIGYLNGSSGIVLLSASGQSLSLTTVGPQGMTFSTNSTNRWQISSAGNLIAAADNTYDIGASGSARPRNLYLSDTLVSGAVRVGAASAGVAGTTTLGNGTATTVGATGAAAALPANPLGYIIAHVGTTQVKIPYYTA